MYEFVKFALIWAEGEFNQVQLALTAQRIATACPTARVRHINI